MSHSAATPTACGAPHTPHRTHDYDDIIELARPVSRRPAMPIRDRAAQFSPFAALTGHRESLAAAQQRMVARINTDNREEDPFGDGNGAIDIA